MVYTKSSNRDSILGDITNTSKIRKRQLQSESGDTSFSDSECCEKKVLDFFNHR